MAMLPDSLKESIKSSIKGGVKSKLASPVKDESTIHLKIIAKNFLALPSIARDLNVARQNIQKLVSLAGEKPATGADAFFLKEEEKERALEAAREKEEEVKPTKVEIKKKPKKKFGLLDIMGVTALIGIAFVGFKDTFIEMASKLWEDIKQKLDEFVEDIKKWFNDSIQPIIDGVKEFVQGVVDKVSSFFTSIAEWVAGKFEKIKEFFEPVVEFIKGVFDKFMGIVNSVKEAFESFRKNAKEIYEGLPGPIKKIVPDFIVKFLQAEPVKEEEPKPVPVTPGYEEEAAVEEMISGIQVPREEAAPPPEVKPPAAPPPKPERKRERVSKPPKLPPPRPAPTPAPAPARPSVTPAPAPPKPITEQPPAPTGKAAEGPEKQIGGSLASVVSTQSGVDMSGLHPEFEKRLTAMAAAFKEQTGKKLLVTSAYRSNEKQAELFNAKLKEFGGDRRKTRRKVAEPMPPLGKGRGSFHLKGLAIDINSKGPAGINVLAGDRENPTGWLEKFGLTRPVAKENWHIQPIGTLPTADNPVNPGAPTLVAGKDAKPMNLAEGKKESIGQPEPTSGATSGATVAAASTDLAAGQRAQQKPSTPIIINSPKTTNTVVQNNVPPVIAKSKTDAGKTLMNRVT